jgi:hydroxymethylpyrimidine/phosphomethylpyrimidine kinase
LAYIHKAAGIIAHIYHEMKLHIDYCNGFGISKEQMINAEESKGAHLQAQISIMLTVEACTAYTRYGS